MCEQLTVFERDIEQTQVASKVLCAQECTCIELAVRGCRGLILQANRPKLTAHVMALALSLVNDSKKVQRCHKRLNEHVFTLFCLRTSNATQRDGVPWTGSTMAGKGTSTRQHMIGSGNQGGRPTDRRYKIPRNSPHRHSNCVFTVPNPPCRHTQFYSG